jgi:AcrR family transcriptional regulator
MEVVTETQRRILSAALSLFAERGYAGTTTAAIASRAGVAEKTLFAQFKNKENLFDRVLSPAALEAASPGAISGMLTIFQGPWESLEEFVSLVMKNRVSFALEHKSWFKLVIQEMLLRPELFERFAKRVETDIWPIVQGKLSRLKELGELRDLPAATVVRSLISLTMGYILHRGIMAPDQEWDDEAEIRAMTGILVQGLRPR